MERAVAGWKRLRGWSSETSPGIGWERSTSPVSISENYEGETMARDVSILSLAAPWIPRAPMKGFWWHLHVGSSVNRFPKDRGGCRRWTLEIEHEILQRLPSVSLQLPRHALGRSGRRRKNDRRKSSWKPQRHGWCPWSRSQHRF